MTDRTECGLILFERHIPAVWRQDNRKNRGGLSKQMTSRHGALGDRALPFWIHWEMFVLELFRHTLSLFHFNPLGCRS